MKQRAIAIFFWFLFAAFSNAANKTSHDEFLAAITAHRQNLKKTQSPVTPKNAWQSDNNENWRKENLSMRTTRSVPADIVPRNLRRCLHYRLLSEGGLKLVDTSVNIDTQTKKVVLKGRLHNSGGRIYAFIRHEGSTSINEEMLLSRPDLFQSQHAAIVTVMREAQFEIKFDIATLQPGQIYEVVYFAAAMSGHDQRTESYRSAIRVSTDGSGAEVVSSNLLWVISALSLGGIVLLATVYCLYCGSEGQLDETERKTEQSLEFEKGTEPNLPAKPQRDILVKGGVLKLPVIASTLEQAKIFMRRQRLIPHFGENKADNDNQNHVPAQNNNSEQGKDNNPQESSKVEHQQNEELTHHDANADSPIKAESADNYHKKEKQNLILAQPSDENHY